MKIKCLVLLICAVSFFGCGESKQTKVEEEVPAVDSSEAIKQDTTASVSELAEAQMDENTIMEIWDAYIKVIFHFLLFYSLLRNSLIIEFLQVFLELLLFGCVVLIVNF